MVIYSRCGTEFDLTRAKRSIGRSYGAGIYSDYFPDGDVCVKCAVEEISADYGSGEEDMKNTAYHWDD